MSTPGLAAANLRCAHKLDPLGVEPDRVRFSWALVGEGRARHQTAYQIVVGASLGPSDDVPAWDSGRRESANSSDVPYGGAPLAPAQRYEWRARVWDESGQQGPWSPTARFETSLGDLGWEADWVGLGAKVGPVEAPSGEGPVDAVALAMQPAQYLRRAFALDKPVRSARLYVTALGVYEVSINGKRVSDAVLAPGWTDYAKRILYQTHDVTDLLVGGDNVVGAVIADGWACSFFGFDGKRPGAHYARYPELLLQLVVCFADGSELTVSTDTEWRGSTGAVVHADLLMGERRDLTKEAKGWDRPGFDSSSWRRAHCRPRGAVPLVARSGPAHPGDRRGPGREHLPALQGRVSCRLWPEPGRLGTASSRGATGHRCPLASRRGARCRREPLRRQPAHGAPDGPVRDRPSGRGPGAAVHVPRLSLCGSHGGARRPRGWRHNGLCRPIRHAARRLFRVFFAQHQPALQEHRLGPARQLHQHPHRLPSARRAVGLAGRCPGFCPHGSVQPRCGLVLFQVGGRCRRRGVAVRRLPGLRAPSRLRLGRFAGVGGRGGDRPLDCLQDVRRQGDIGAELPGHEQRGWTGWRPPTPAVSA